MSQEAFWSARYKEEGAIWHNEPSLTALFLAKTVPLGSQVLDTGFGYGRDVIYLARRGFQVTGIEQSAIGVQMAEQRTAQLTFQTPPQLIQGDFLRLQFQPQSFAGIYAHRVLHLLDEPQVMAYTEKVAHLLRPQGKLFIAARDDRGQKPERAGHQVSFWNEARFERTFAAYFNIQSFIKGEEIESASSSASTYFTLMIAELKG